MAARPSRNLHLIDAENLGRSPRPSRDEAELVHSTYLDLVGCEAPDHAVVACNHGAAIEVGSAWAGARLLLASGKDGADNALLDVLAREDVPRRYDGVVVGSGDGIFVDAVLELRASGVAVTVVAPPEALSRRLALAATAVVPFVAPEPRSPAPAMGLLVPSALRSVA
ncbi:MAG: NYN domain-containing protein [Acidimicrobiales bacterium]